MSDSGRPGKQLGHPADPGAKWVATGVQKDEMGIFAAPAHNKNEGVIKRSDRSCVFTAPAHKREQQGERAKGRNMRICCACEQKKRGDRPARSDAFCHNLT